MNASPRRSARVLRGRTADLASGELGLRALATGAIACAVLAGCGSGGSASEAGASGSIGGAPASSAAETTAPDSSSPEKASFLDGLRDAGYPGLPESVGDTLWAVGQRVCALRSKGATREEMLGAVSPVAESVASIVPGKNAHDVSEAVADSALAADCP